MRLELSLSSKENYRAYKRARQTLISRNLATKRGWRSTKPEHFEALYQKTLAALQQVIIDPEARRMFIGYLPWVKAQAMTYNLDRKERDYKRLENDLPPIIKAQQEMEIAALRRSIEDLKSQEHELDRRLVKEAFLEVSVRQYLTKLEERHFALIGQKKYKRTKPLEMAEKHNVSLQRIREEERRQKLLDDDAYWAARNKK